MLAGASGEDRDAVARHLRSTWLSFANHGSPAAGAEWPKYDPDDRRTMVFDSGVRAASGR